MGTPKQRQKAKKIAAMSATELVLGGQSEARQQGRRLLLKFIGGANPELDRIECRWSKDSQPAYWQQGDPPEKSPMSWTPVPQALALIFLNYLCAAGQEGIGPVFFSESNSGGLAVPLGNAISDRDGRLHDLFVESLEGGKPRSRVKLVFSGKNVHGKDNSAERRIFVRSDFLPLDCIELHWTAHEPQRVTDPGIIQELRRRTRKALGIPVEPDWPPMHAGEGSREKKPETVAPAEATKPQKPADEPTTPVFPELEAKIAAAQSAKPVTAPDPNLSLASEKPRPPLLSSRELVDKLLAQQPPPSKPATPQVQIELKSEAEEAQEPSEPATPPLPPINPQLFAIHNPDQLAWNDSMGLLDFGDDDTGDDIWRVKDACEGVLVLGAPGSGKTSASGFAIAQAFLTAGFGGLVLVAKTDEARRWQSLCARFGRAEDCVVVTRNGPYKLNALAYETQRPGERLGLTDDLIAFFRILIAIVSKRTSHQANEDFWTNATNQLMRELFDAFLLAGEPLTIDGLTRFLAKAPEEPTRNWQAIEFFGKLLLRAEKNAQSPEDQRIYRRVRDYWTAAYPKIAHQTRSGIVLGFTAMANALSGRGIHELISSETTLTPESILSGKIVILDLPLKECGQGGHLIQAAWKYLFQRAIERRADKGQETARPVFLWEDEGHLFFSQHDIDFQPTARDCRAAHVIISQSLHNFYQLGHNPHAVQGVFATMNSHIYHANGDLETNTWCSEKLGTSIKTLVNVSVSSQPKHSAQPKHWFFDMFKQEERESTSSTSVNQHREKIFQPESFAQLKKAGDGTCEAVVHWVSHQFKANEGRPFQVRIFEQDNNQ